MDLVVMDDTFKSIYLFDSFESLIWTERYDTAGDFEIYTPYGPDLKELVQFISGQLNRLKDTYVWFSESEAVMIIDTMELTEDETTGSHLKLTGSSLEFILDRRSIWKQTRLDSKVDYAINRLLNENVISPNDSDRKIPGFVYKKTIDEEIDKLKISKQYTGDNLYDIIVEICQLYGLGFRIRLDDQNQFIFELYQGIDRSYDQTKNAYVEFSSTFENLYGSNLLKSNRTLKTVTLVAGEDLKVGDSRKTLIVGGSETGLSRRELYTDARDIQSELENGTNMSDEEYYAKLEYRGLEKLSENKSTKAIEPSIDTTSENFVYGKDYFIGDIVQVVTEYGIETKARVTEMVRSYDLSGYSAYPTFTVMDEKGD